MFNINNKKNHCFKKHLKEGDEVMKKVCPIIQCSMDEMGISETGNGLNKKAKNNLPK